MKSRFTYLLLSLVCLLSITSVFAQERIGLVLSGGGARGMAHIGVLKALEENNIPIDYITGTSAGALIGAMYSIGFSPDEIEQLVLTNEFRQWASGEINEDLDYYFNKREPDASWVSLKFRVDSVVKATLPTSVVNSARTDFALTENMSMAIARAGYSFDSLFVPFRCVAADIRSKKQAIFNSGDLPLAVRASMAYPFYFTPVVYNGMILYDGGIYNNFPVDIMQSDFNPDVIIGVNAGSYPDIPYEENLFSLFSTMVVQTTTYAVPDQKDVMLSPQVESIGVFDFVAAKAAIDSGYYYTIRHIDEIKAKIARRTSQEELATKRQTFKNGFVPITIDNITTTGIDIPKEIYVRKSLNAENKCLSIAEFKPLYFRLLSDDNIKSLFPSLKFNDSTGYYDLNLLVKKENDLMIDFGGNISSSPINEGFVGLQYNLLGKSSLILNGNIYFGKLYNSAELRARYDIRGRTDFYLEPVATWNRYDYYKSSSYFLEDVKPSFLVQSDRSVALNAGIPARNKGKVYFSGGAFELKNSYYQTRDFSTKDIEDVTRFSGWTTALHFDRNTLNRNMYASKGSYFKVSGRYVSGIEHTIPGSTGFAPDTVVESHDWFQLSMNYENFFSKAGRFRFGFGTDMYFSSQPFFANYTATVLSAQAYQPIPQSQTIFLEDYRAHNYLGGGLISVYNPFGNFDLRAEGYIFQPFQEIQQGSDLKAKYGSALSNRYLLGTLAAIYHTPVGPMSLSLNYYELRDKPFSVLFHLGFIIFNKRALD